MNKEEQVLLGFRDLYNKLVWLNKDKMEESLRVISLLRYIASNILKRMQIPM